MSDATWSPIVEFRQYTLHPGARDALIELVDREFIESQEELEMKVIGLSGRSTIPTASSGCAAIRTCRPVLGPSRPTTTDRSGRSTALSPTQR
ncbi:MAG: hypothetical protein ACRDO9_13675 [Gaiellales bacterium]